MGDTRDISVPALDPSRLDALREVDPGLAGEVAAVWLKTTPEVLARLVDSAAAGDDAELAAAAHALRGSSANVGADPLADACARLEVACRDGGDVAGALAQVCREHERAAAALARVATG